MDCQNPSVTELLGIGLCSVCLNVNDRVKNEIKTEDDFADLDWIQPAESDFGDIADLADLAPLKPKKKHLTSKKKVVLKKKFKNSKIKTEIPRQISFYKKMVDGKARIICPICKRTFSDVKNAKDHAKMEHLYGDFKCAGGDNFKTNFADQLFEHIRNSELQFQELQKIYGKKSSK